MDVDDLSTDHSNAAQSVNSIYVLPNPMASTSHISVRASCPIENSMQNEPTPGPSNSNTVRDRQETNNNPLQQVDFFI